MYIGPSNIGQWVERGTGVHGRANGGQSAPMRLLFLSVPDLGQATESMCAFTADPNQGFHGMLDEVSLNVFTVSISASFASSASTYLRSRVFARFLSLSWSQLSKASRVSLLKPPADVRGRLSGEQE